MLVSLLANWSLLDEPLSYWTFTFWVNTNR